MTTYTFTNDSYWFSNGCDCCEDLLMESFNSDQTCCNFGSAYSEEDCYLQAIATELGYEFWEHVPDSYREMGHAELKMMADNMNIKVEVVS
jgi:hypothetical protein